jgi:hypothetical protein
LIERAPMSAWMRCFAPGARGPYLRRHLDHAREEARLATAPQVVQVRPPTGAPDVARLSKDLELVAGAITTGKNALHAALALAEEQPRRGTG